MVVTFILAVINAMVMQNVVLVKGYGFGPTLNETKRIRFVVAVSSLITCLMVISTMLLYPIYHYLLTPDFTYFILFMFVLVIMALAQLLHCILAKFIPTFTEQFGWYMPIIMVNAIVLGATQESITTSAKFSSAVAQALGTGLGFIGIMVVFYHIQVRLETSRVPKPLKGIPIALITAGILALSLAGLAGIIKS